MKYIGCSKINLSTIADLLFLNKFFGCPNQYNNLQNTPVTTLLYEDNKMCYHHSDRSKLQSSLPSYSKVHMTPLLFKKARLDLSIITIMIRITMAIKNLVRKRGESSQVSQDFATESEGSQFKNQWALGLAQGPNLNTRFPVTFGSKLDKSE